MAFSWVTAGLLSLNACTSATIGGLVSYCIFKGEDKSEQQDKEIKELEEQLNKAKEDFEKESKAVEGDDSVRTVALEKTIATLASKQTCLYRMKENYERRIKELGGWRIFKTVKYGGEHCK